METYRFPISYLGQMGKLMKGNKSHQFTTESGMRIYFNEQELPVNAADDSLVTNLECHILEKWIHEYHYDLAETDPVTALNIIKNASGSVILEVLQDAKRGEKYRYRYWWWEPRSQEDKFTVEELLEGTWYSVVDVY